MHNEHLQPPDDQCFASVGYICSMLKITPAQLTGLMEDTEVRFARAVDGVYFLDNDGFLAIAEKLREVLTEIESVSTSHERN